MRLAKPPYELFFWQLRAIFPGIVFSGIQEKTRYGKDKNQ
jgi:hypothetical protein